MPPGRNVAVYDVRAAASLPSRKRNQVHYLADSDDKDYGSYDASPSFKKRKSTGGNTVIDLTVDDDDEVDNYSHKRKEPPKNNARSDKGKNEEKRMRRFRSHPPQSYLVIKQRALSQRLTVITRERVGTDDEPEEKVTMAGSTGNVYTQHIGHVPSCDCPHAKKGNQCKHIIYVMLRVLKAAENIAYQLALTSSELQDLFRNAAPIPSADSGIGDGHETEMDGNRKKIEGECPICYCDFEPGTEAIVYCKAACGNNVHKSCMQSWIIAKGIGRATCPYCRAKWEDSDGGSFSGKVDLKSARRTEEGYINIASQLGLSDERDYSSYHQPWSRQQGFGGYRYSRY
ncbi:hypothetical protein DPSP01_007795 [Paraphaeosphaeria sporulosa]|uniref:Uncharacterized protein n=1 Tax=Paraphaeosphaeria sporulosa TaxID=1460663 RepID=A0A177CKI4_9PLEO|nr:uncharacterized protein CC84DRAFT_1216425 [Paraphaeosphaeria sporulosa]OAG07472.1 hypothetical protein CC84DRAFT_1216425 [Paraphaeosphaeria sporulosa]